MTGRLPGCAFFPLCKLDFDDDELICLSAKGWRLVVDGALEEEEEDAERIRGTCSAPFWILALFVAAGLAILCFSRRRNEGLLLLAGPELPLSIDCSFSVATLFFSRFGTFFGVARLTADEPLLIALLATGDL